MDLWNVIIQFQSGILNWGSCRVVWQSNKRQLCMGRLLHVVWPSVWTKQNLDSSVNRGPVSKSSSHSFGPRPIVVVGGPDWVEHGCKIFWREDWRHCPDSLNADFGLSGVQEVRTKGLSRVELIFRPIRGARYQSFLVFFFYCSLSANWMSSHRCTRGGVSDPRHGNHTLRNTKVVYLINLHASSFKHSKTTRQFITRQMMSQTLLCYCQRRSSTTWRHLAKRKIIENVRNHSLCFRAHAAIVKSKKR
jgi:hypothetical protein